MLFLSPVRDMVLQKSCDPAGDLIPSSPTSTRFGELLLCIIPPMESALPAVAVSSANVPSGIIHSSEGSCSFFSIKIDYNNRL
jgi:hypothetical protein